MKNRNIQFKATALRCKNTGFLLVCLAAVFISAPNPASALDMVPFNGTVSGFVESQSGTECEPSVHVINFGHANQLGAFTGTAEFFPRPCEPDPDLCENNIPLATVRVTSHGISCSTPVNGQKLDANEEPK